MKHTHNWQLASTVTMEQRPVDEKRLILGYYLIPYEAWYVGSCGKRKLVRFEDE